MKSQKDILDAANENSQQSSKQGGGTSGIELLISKVKIMRLPKVSTEGDNQIEQLALFMSNLKQLKEIDFPDDISFGLNEIQILIKHTSSTDLSERLLQWIIPKLSLVDLKKLIEFLPEDREIVQNLSFINFSGNPYLLSKEAIQQKISELRNSKKTKVSKEEKEGEEEAEAEAEDGEDAQNGDGDGDEKKKGSNNEKAQNDNDDDNNNNGGGNGGGAEGEEGDEDEEKGEDGNR